MVPFLGINLSFSTFNMSFMLFGLWPLFNSSEGYPLWCIMDLFSEASLEEKVWGC